MTATLDDLSRWRDEVGDGAILDQCIVRYILENDTTRKPVVMPDEIKAVLDQLS